MDPAITISASAVTIIGTAVPISMSVQLVDPNNTGGLKIVGGGIITNRVEASTAAPASTITMQVYGNDVIEDANNNVGLCYYVVKIFLKNVLTPFFQGNYQFAGSGTIDILSAEPYNPAAGIVNEPIVGANLFWGNASGSPAAPAFSVLPGMSDNTIYLTVFTAAGLQAAISGISGQGRVVVPTCTITWSTPTILIPRQVVVELTAGATLNYTGSGTAVQIAGINSTGEGGLVGNGKLTGAGSGVGLLLGDTGTSFFAYNIEIGEILITGFATGIELGNNCYNATLNGTISVGNTTDWYTPASLVGSGAPIEFNSAQFQVINIAGSPAPNFYSFNNCMLDNYTATAITCSQEGMSLIFVGCHGGVKGANPWLVFSNDCDVSLTGCLIEVDGSGATTGISGSAFRSFSMTGSGFKLNGSALTTGVSLNGTCVGVGSILLLGNTWVGVTTPVVNTSTGHILSDSGGSLIVKSHGVLGTLITDDGGGGMTIQADGGSAVLSLNPTGCPVVIGGALVVAAHTPSSATGTGVAGTICADALFVYVCVSTNAWKRSAISTW